MKTEIKIHIKKTLQSDIDLTQFGLDLAEVTQTANRQLLQYSRHLDNRVIQLIDDDDASIRRHSRLTAIKPSRLALVSELSLIDKT